jgi:undecaprenyl-diphosphatase
LSLSRLWLFVVFITFVAVGAVATIGIARVYVGVHYPGDIMGGIGCGFVSALLVTVVRPFVEPLLTSIIHIAERLHLA